jgi:hypothetical protein
MKTKNIAFLLALILGVGILRLYIPIPNFSPIAAMALSGGFLLGKNKWAFIIPIAGLLFSDLFLGLVSKENADYLFSISFVLVYISYILTVLIGSYIKKSASWTKLAGAAIFSSVIYYLITNFGAWLYDPVYTKDMAGLIQSYIAGLVFYRQQFFGSFFFNHVIATLFFTLMIIACHRFCVNVMFINPVSQKADSHK